MLSISSESSSNAMPSRLVLNSPWELVSRPTILAVERENAFNAWHLEECMVQDLKD